MLWLAVELYFVKVVLLFDCYLVSLFFRLYFILTYFSALTVYETGGTGTTVMKV